MRTATDNQIEIFFIRHGKTAGNLRKAYIGITDERLCEQGREELLNIQKTGNLPGVDRVFASPMKRCIESAGILFPQEEAVVISRFRETDFGSFEGKNYQELSDNPQYQAFIDSNGEIAFPGGESKQEASKRALKGMKEMLAFIREENRKELGKIKKAAAVVHGGTIMSILSYYAGGAYYDYQVANGKGYVLSFSYSNEETEIKNVKVRLWNMEKQAGQKSD